MGRRVIVLCFIWWTMGLFIGTPNLLTGVNKWTSQLWEIKQTFSELEARSAFLRAQNEEQTFLGKISLDRFDRNSLSREYGNFGDRLSTRSILNPYSIYGSSTSPYSAFNPNSFSPPEIVVYDEEGTAVVIGYLTVNPRYRGAPNTLNYDARKLLIWLEEQQYQIH